MLLDSQRAEAERAHLISGGRYAVLLAGLCAALAASIAVATAIGTADVPLSTVTQVILGHIGLGTGGLDPTLSEIIWQFRVPRVLLAALAGAGLAVAGVCLQATVRNPLADPYLLGVSSGASLGAVLVLTASSATAASLGVTGAAFIGALLSTVLVFLLAQRGARVSPVRLVLAGVAIDYIGSAATSYIQLRAQPGEMSGILFWLLGSVSGASWPELRWPALLIALTSLWLVFQGRGMNALAVGDDTAAGLGVNVNRLRISLLAVASLLTATVVSVAGGIAFVGLMIPHAVRLLVGPDHRKLLPASLLTGAVFLVLVDLVSRTIDKPNELPLGIFTAAIGAPFFLVLMRRQGRN